MPGASTGGSGHGGSERFRTARNTAMCRHFGTVAGAPSPMPCGIAGRSKGRLHAIRDESLLARRGFMSTRDAYKRGSTHDQVATMDDAVERLIEQQLADGCIPTQPSRG